MSIESIVVQRSNPKRHTYVRMILILIASEVRQKVKRQIEYLPRTQTRAKLGVHTLNFEVEKRPKNEKNYFRLEFVFCSFFAPTHSYFKFHRGRRNSHFIFINIQIMKNVFYFVSYVQNFLFHQFILNTDYCTYILLQILPARLIHVKYIN